MDGQVQGTWLVPHGHQYRGINRLAGINPASTVLLDNKDWKPDIIDIVIQIKINEDVRCV